MNKPLPPGQFEYPSFDRFGLGLFAKRLPHSPDLKSLRIAGDVRRETIVGRELTTLPRVEQVSDFHCVTTWSCRGLRWSGVRFSEFYRDVVQRCAEPLDGADFVVFRGQDGYAVSMQLTDLMASRSVSLTVPRGDSSHPRIAATRAPSTSRRSSSGETAATIAFLFPTPT